MAKRKERVNHPSHYNEHASIECIVIVEHFNFNIGNAIKYLWRAGWKSKNPAEDLQKASWYVNREIGRIADRRIRSKKKKRSRR